MQLDPDKQRLIRDLCLKLTDDIERALTRAMALHIAVEDDARVRLIGLAELGSSAVAPGIATVRQAIRMAGQDLSVLEVMILLAQSDGTRPMGEMFDRVRRQAKAVEGTQ